MIGELVHSYRTITTVTLPIFLEIYANKGNIVFFFYKSYNMGSSKPITIKKRVDFPVYGLDFTADDTLIAAGGGGANRSGVKNNLVK